MKYVIKPNFLETGYCLTCKDQCNGKCGLCAERNNG